MVKYCLFGGFKLTKTADPHNYSYSRYNIGFDSLHFFHIRVLIETKMLLFLE